MKQKTDDQAFKDGIIEFLEQRQSDGKLAIPESVDYVWDKAQLAAKKGTTPVWIVVVLFIFIFANSFYGRWTINKNIDELQEAITTQCIHP